MIIRMTNKFQDQRMIQGDETINRVIDDFQNPIFILLKEIPTDIKCRNDWLINYL